MLCFRSLNYKQRAGAASGEMPVIGRCLIDPRSALRISGERTMQKAFAIPRMAPFSVGATVALQTENVRDGGSVAVARGV
jgi:hypothetical protein